MRSIKEYLQNVNSYIKSSLEPPDVPLYQDLLEVIDILKFSLSMVGTQKCRL